MAPKDTPAEIVERLNTTMNAGLADPTLKERLAELGCLVYPGTPAAMATFVAGEIDKWAQGDPHRRHQAGVGGAKNNRNQRNGS